MYTKMLRTPVVNKLWSCCSTSVSHAVFNSILNQHMPLQVLLTQVWQTAVDKLWSCCYVHSCFTRFTQLHAHQHPSLLVLLTQVWQTAVDKLWSCCYVHSCFTRFTQLHAQPAPFFTGAADTSLTNCCWQTLILLLCSQLFHTLYSTPCSTSTLLYWCCWHKFEKLLSANFNPVVCSIVVSHAVRWQFPCLVHGHLLWLHNHRHRCCWQKRQTLGPWFWWSEEITLCTRWQVSKDLYTSFLFFSFPQDAFVSSSVEIE